MEATASYGDRDRRRRAPLAKVGMAVAVLAFIALLFYGISAKAPETSIDDALAQGQAATPPAFELPVLQRGEAGAGLAGEVERALGDGSLELSELRGTPVVLNFWASWCLPCREEAPALERIWRGEREQGVLFVGLNMQDLSGDAREFIGEFGTTYPNVRDESNEVALEWGVSGLPETFFLSAEGEVVGHVIGVVSEEQLRDGVAAARSGQVIGPVAGGDRRPTE